MVQPKYPCGITEAPHLRDAPYVAPAPCRPALPRKEAEASVRGVFFCPCATCPVGRVNPLAPGASGAATRQTDAARPERKGAKARSGARDTRQNSQARGVPAYPANEGVPAWLRQEVPPDIRFSGGSPLSRGSYTRERTSVHRRR